jgi:sugar lactone lactonase YvrE
MMVKTRFASIILALGLLAAIPLAAQDPTPTALATAEPTVEPTIDATVEPTVEVPTATTEATVAAPVSTVEATAETPMSTSEPMATVEATQEMMDMSHVVVGGLHAPRHFVVWNDDIYIAEAGTGGASAVDSPFGTLMVGGTGQITKVTEGAATPFIVNLFSSFSETGEATGPHAVYIDDTAAWVLVGQGIPDLNVEFPTFALVQFSPDGLTQGTVIDLYANERVNNPDGGEIDSNPVDFVVAPDGTVFVADAGANAILRVDPDGTVSTFAVWPPEEGQPQAVPTSLALDPDGNLYVGFLTGFPFPVGGAWVEELDPTGASIGRWDGLTMVTDIELAPDGTLYAVEFGQFGEQGPVFNSGRIVRLTASGPEPVVTGLNFPFSMALRPDGTFYVTNNSSFVAEGQILWVSEGEDFTPPVPQPAATDAAPAATSEATAAPVGTTEATVEAPVGTAEATVEVPVGTAEATAETPVGTAKATIVPTAEATTAP